MEETMAITKSAKLYKRYLKVFHLAGSWLDLSVQQQITWNATIDYGSPSKPNKFVELKKNAGLHLIIPSPMLELDLWLLNCRSELPHPIRKCKLCLRINQAESCVETKWSYNSSLGFFLQYQWELGLFFLTINGSDNQDIVF